MQQVVANEEGRVGRLQTGHGLQVGRVVGRDQSEGPQLQVGPRHQDHGQPRHPECKGETDETAGVEPVAKAPQGGWQEQPEQDRHDVGEVERGEHLHRDRDREQDRIERTRALQPAQDQQDDERQPLRTQHVDLRGCSETHRMESEHDRSESSRWRIDPAPRKCVRGESAQRIGEEDQDIRRELRVAGRKEGRCEKRCKSEKVLRVGECMLRGVKDVGLEELAERKRDQCVRAPGEFPDDQVHVGGA